MGLYRCLAWVSRGTECAFVVLSVHGLSAQLAVKSVLDYYARS